MKLKFILTAMVATVAVAAFTGCSDSSKSSTPDASATNAMAAAATNAAMAAGSTVTNAAAAATSQADDIIAQAKSLIADKKYSDALTALNGLSGTTLTADQQKAIDDLKTQIQQAMAGGAASALPTMPK